MDKPDLVQLEYFASLLLTDVELDDLIEHPRGTVETAVRNRQSDIGKAVRTGRLKTKCELRESILTTARRHSTPAQQMAAEMLRNLEAQ